MFSSPVVTVLLTVLTATLLQTVSAHSRLWAISINGEDQGIGCKNLKGNTKKYIRCAPNTHPITHEMLNSPNTACNVGGNDDVGEWLPVKWGDKITFQWGHSQRSIESPDDKIISESHKGPVLVYASPAPDGTKGEKSWLKLFHSAGSGKTWATNELSQNKGLHWIELPQLPPGKYLLRPELIALHNAAIKPDRAAPEPQFYMSCVQVEVMKEEGRGAEIKKDAEKVAFPGAYPDLKEVGKWKDVGLEFNTYTNKDTGVERYSKVMPGPKLAVDDIKGGFGEAPKRRRRKV
ncbi:hypothetical protein EX30DRAFT_334102 [Ascodesmis nigricans]|uniref:AA9 family lytic polysaccharide monooxygenase n=1 Tax=Ascodesmis nigricans TaxID=341454 RepID=A0A4V3SI51_9PEZI|nr:hypothetical protein EX30DRAFT_334102 [Ascodesmis nigricans]